MAGTQGGHGWEETEGRDGAGRAECCHVPLCRMHPRQHLRESPREGLAPAGTQQVLGAAVGA